MRALALASLLALAILAGCFGGKHDDSGTPPAPVVPDYHPVVAPAFHRSDGRPATAAEYGGEPPVMAERYIGERGGGEPTIGINKRGVAIYPSIAFDLNARVTTLPTTRVMISDDEGKNWTDRTPTVGNLQQAPNAAPASLDPYVYADPVSGRLFNIDLNLAAGAFLSWSDDDGRTWVSNPGCCGLPVDDHQTLFAGPATTLAANPVLSPGRILYYCINQIASSSCTRSVDGGLTWLAPTSAFPGAEASTDGQVLDHFCGGLHGHGHASEATGTVFVPKGQCGIPTVARSADNGLTWEVVRLDDSYGIDGHEAIVSTDRSGNVYYFFLDQNTYPRLSVSRDDGRTWSTPINVSVPGLTRAKFPSITAGDDGHIAFLYLGTTSPRGQGLYDEDNQTYMENATWSAYVGFSLTALDDDPVFYTTTAHEPADPIARGGCAGRCFGTVGGGMYDFLDIDTNPTNGQVWVALVDNCNDDTPYHSAPCNGPDGKFDSFQRSRAAVGVQVGGTLLGSRLP